MAKEPGELKWIEDLLPEGYYHRKSMFGGFSYYIGEKMVLLIFESDDKRWNGCMFPVDKEYQATALASFPQLVPHTILPKWLYLSVNTENFDEVASDIMKHVLRPNGFWGTIPKEKKKSLGAGRASGRGKKKNEVDMKIDTRRPRMFSDEPMDLYLEKAQKISDLKNLGAESEKSFERAGIKTAQQFIKMGWQKAMLKLISLNDKHRHSMYAYALIGALKNLEFNRISEEDKLAARTFVRGLKKIEKKGPAKKVAPKKTAKKVDKKSASKKPVAKKKKSRK
jgi:TfoX C-terminal domain.